MLHIIMTHKPILHIKCLINEKSRKNDQTWRTMKPQIIKSACLVTKTFENYSFIDIYLLKIVQPNFLKKSLFAKKKKVFLHCQLLQIHCQRIPVTCIVHNVYCYTAHFHMCFKQLHLLCNQHGDFAIDFAEKQQHRTGTKLPFQLLKNIESSQQFRVNLAYCICKGCMFSFQPHQIQLISQNQTD